MLFKPAAIQRVCPVLQRKLVGYLLRVVIWSGLQQSVRASIGRNRVLAEGMVYSQEVSSLYNGQTA